MTITLRPSGSSIWTKCHANPRISANAKREAEDSDAAREGTCAAWVAEQAIRGNYDPTVLLNATHENGWIVDDEMVFHVQNYVTMLRSRGGTLSTEVKVRFNDYIQGTYDASTVVTPVLYLDDLKYGYKLVDVWENTQTIIYAYSELARLNDPSITHVVLGIYQPRAWHPEGIHRTWRLSVQELHQHALRINEASVACQSPEAVATPGEHCEYCKGRNECEALAATVYNDYEVIERSGSGAMSAEELSKEGIFLQRAEAVLKARKSAVEAEMKARIESGEHIPAWGLKDRTGHRKFTADPVTIQLVTGIDPHKQVLMTPAELERCGAKLSDLGLTVTPVVGKKLDRFTDRDFGRLFRDR